MAFADTDEGFTKFGQATGYFCAQFNQYDMLLFVLIAVLGGLFGALFNHVVEKLNHWRSHSVNLHWKRRVLEVVILCLVSSTARVLLPAGYSCLSTSPRLLLEDSMGCLSEADARQVYYGRVSHAALSHLLGNPTAHQMAAQERLAAWQTEAARWQEEEDDHWKEQVWISNDLD